MFNNNPWISSIKRLLIMKFMHNSLIYIGKPLIIRDFYLNKGLPEYK